MLNIFFFFFTCGVKNKFWWCIKEVARITISKHVILKSPLHFFLLECFAELPSQLYKQHSVEFSCESSRSHFTGFVLTKISLKKIGKLQGQNWTCWFQKQIGGHYAESTGKCCLHNMMTSSNGNFFCFTGPLCGEFTGHRWILLTKASDVELWCFLWSAPWINGWVNNREAGDLRCHRTHYDIIVM